MPMEVQVIYASEFVREGAQGDFDFAASKVALEELARACHKRGMNKALLDLRKVQGRLEPIFSPTELASLVNSFYEMGFNKRDRLAVLFTADPHHRAHLFAFIGRMQGWNVAAFDNFEEAFLWLAGGGTSKLDVQAA